MSQTITNRVVIQAWSAAAAAHADDFGEEGDFARQHLLNPAIFSLLGDVRDQRVLDAGCGQGYLARLLARRGAVVTGVEPAAGWYEQAVARERAHPQGITYLQEDLATFSLSHAHLEPFDAVVANMVLIDIPEDEAAIRSCIAALRPGGSFVFSLIHPCFEEDGPLWGGREYVAVREYLHEYTIPQTFATPRFHRPLSHYVNAVIQAGANIAHVLEPQLGPEWADAGPWCARNQHVPSFLMICATRTG
jgi:2-polyprenyl-3-methyl-5-hydroxy-6-metoxy-1,4-benzoquinol methylase